MSLFNSLPKALEFGGSSYKVGLLVGYLLNGNNHPLNVRITASASVAPTSVLKQYGIVSGLISGITDIADLHTRTLWLGSARIKGKGRFGQFLSDKDIGCYKNFLGSYFEIGCNGFIESLIFDFGFLVERIDHNSVMNILPPPIFSNSGSRADICRSFEGGVLEKAVNKTMEDCNDREVNRGDFIRGIIDGFNY